MITVNPAKGLAVVTGRYTGIDDELAKSAAKEELSDCPIV
ncbi:tRNA G37 N-methylase TrmD [Rhizobium sp. BK619]|nr:tRNA G37 N-methylase TrmD [Rhizobium sp. BK619]